MTVTGNLAQARAAPVMIQPEPFNVEAPPEALAGEITPTALHYVRSNFALPAHDGTLEIGGAVENPRTLALDDLRAMPSAERVVTMECAGNGRLTAWCAIRLLGRSGCLRRVGPGNVSGRAERS